MLDLISQIKYPATLDCTSYHRLIVAPTSTLSTISGRMNQEAFYPADASKPAQGTNGNLISTPDVEGLGGPDELVGYAQLVSFIDSSKWNVKRGVVRKKGAVVISFQA